MADTVDMTKTMAVAHIAAVIAGNLVHDRGIGQARSMIPEAVEFARRIIWEATKSLQVNPLE
jgi:hypothetical protein